MAAPLWILAVLACVLFIATPSIHAETIKLLSESEDGSFSRSRSKSDSSSTVSSSSSSDTSLRHVRHLSTRTSHGPSAEAEASFLREDFSGSHNMLVSPVDVSGGTRLTVQDNHKPVFLNCTSYQPSVKEDQPRGTYVAQVTAIDRDPPENGGKITYSFVMAPGTHMKFQINETNGIITTTQMLDRDEPSREKEFYLTVRATDNGFPPLDDVCTVRVLIEDINDNKPLFDKVRYIESVPQDLPAGREVMRISANDIDDGNNSLVVYSLRTLTWQDEGFFHINKNTGVISLDKAISRDPGYRFKMQATATDLGEVPNSVQIGVDIEVIESNKKAPSFQSIPASPIMIDENLNDYSYHIATIVAMSNTDETAPVFELVVGRTEQTNKNSHFRLQSEGRTAHIILGKNLDYESISEFTLTIRIENKYNLAAETSIGIQLRDVNDNFPTFTEVVSGSVQENEPPGTPVMQVRAIDADGTSANNQVTYELADNDDYFTIDPYTGNITTLVTFDREKKDYYNVKVIATDNSPSALYNTSEHNKGQQVFRIEIADKNDHAPQFTEAVYVAESIAENANKNEVVLEVNAVDEDTASPVMYSIVDGNTYDAFEIEETTGKIKVHNHLDYENITSYTLTVRAFDGVYEDHCKVEIKISNVNDNPPVFLSYQNNVTIREEELISGCIVKLEAYDPDIPDRGDPQNIVYFVVKEEQKKFLMIDKEGCLSLVQPLDRDPPNGFEIWQVLIAANDENGGQNFLGSSTEVVITLIDINDNSPVLNMTNPVIWRENQNPGIITQLIAKDNDGPENGRPFAFSIAPDANPDIVSKFGIQGNQLAALVTFDREEQKSYRIPIVITDSGIPQMTGTSTLSVVIGDQNDNEMREGASSIFVYNYKGEAPDTDIGRVYVEDPDDWDLGDKSFAWTEGPHPHFELNNRNGFITMMKGTPADMSYLLRFTVYEESLLIARHKVEATVNVTVKNIPEEAVDKSGSLRLQDITAEEFITPNSDGISKRMLLQSHLAALFNISEDNVDVFTVLHSPLRASEPLLDVRFSAHGSPYYPPEKINAAININREQMEDSLKVKILMVNIDECAEEKKFCESSCKNFLFKDSTMVATFTNQSSFVGVKAVVTPFCNCDIPVEPTKVCLNGGTMNGDKCECMDGFSGPLCEISGIGFWGEGWALYPTLQSCQNSHLGMELRPNKENGLVFYIGPTSVTSPPLVQDFMALELRNGYPVLLVDFGTGTVKVEHRQIKITDGAMHRVDIYWTRKSVELQVDDCKLSSCLSLSTPQGPNELLNVNEPLQLGGTYMDLDAVASYMNWTHKPLNMGYSGCVTNVTFNGQLYQLGRPSLAENVDVGCSRGTAVAVTFGVDNSFIIAIILCMLTLLLLLLFVVIHRGKADNLYKDTDDIRENIINYEDEGGGEGDMTSYDLNVLRLNYSQPTMNGHCGNGGIADPPDICGFLDDKKRIVDNDPETNPFDDVRHYAYEGDGNTTGSLSSLASGTDEGDLNFDYLPTFGPRFRKLADIYGDDNSDEEEDDHYPLPNSSTISHPWSASAHNSDLNMQQMGNL
ncbi:hypothetical protein LSTR_LSTR009965 [Laodelphax striatellus]|uniref:DE-cadherin n=1 Tax=Laodelphax striatellus TaxID=195883 RepID=A0A482XHR3_LAOST|nr:hypothetical protein LSTR_LSTR009965 [Laodelphax striatellus]